MGDDSRHMLSFLFDSVAGGLGLGVTPAGVSATPEKRGDRLILQLEAVSLLVEVNGQRLPDRVPVVMPPHEIRKDALRIVVVD